MKKFILLVMLAVSIFTSTAFSYVSPYPDWEWVDGTWVYTGTEPDPIPPPKPPING
ncbi:MAG: hypothetical protein JXN63_04585 [Candidatus Delongbacteria bacterium]|nr:hypothetical protein [Candidatus Delongbacteria bacterium]